jgi:hypothetical protein
MTREQVIEKIDGAIEDIQNGMGKYVTVRMKLDGQYHRSSFKPSEKEEIVNCVEKWIEEGAIQVSISATDDRWY